MSELPDGWWRKEHTEGKEPIKGMIPVGDAQGNVKLVPWQESASPGTADGMKFGPSPSDKAGRGFKHPAEAQQELREWFQATAPPIVKTSDIAKVRRLTVSLVVELNRMRNLLKRDVTPADLNDDWERALKVEAWKSGLPITDAHLRDVAAVYLRTETQRIREIDGKKVTKEHPASHGYL